MNPTMDKKTLSDEKKVKLLYLLDDGTSSDELVKKRSKEVLKLFNTVIREGKLEILDRLIDERFEKLNRKKKTKDTLEDDWDDTAESMRFIESCKYLEIELNLRREKYKEKFVGMDFIYNKSELFLHNHNLLMLRVCSDLSLDEIYHFLKTYEENFDEKNTEEPIQEKFLAEIFRKNKNELFKNLIFLYVIRNMEANSKLSTHGYGSLTKVLKCVPPPSTSDETSKLQDILSTLETYEISLKPPGYCLVFIVSENREGYKAEEKNLEITFKEMLGYETEIIIDPTTDKLRQTKEKMEKKHMSVYDSFLCWILAHGNRSELKMEDKKILRSDFVKKFSENKNFKMKPKLFFLSTCQGGQCIDVPTGESKNLDQSSQPIRTLSAEANKDPELEKNTLLAFATLPDHVSLRNPLSESKNLSESSQPIRSSQPISEANKDPELERDTLLAFATLPDHVSLRNSLSGSLYASTICKYIEDSIEEHINVFDLLTSVNNNIHEYAFKTNDSRWKQACYFNSSLRKKFMFKKLTK